MAGLLDNSKHLSRLFFVLKTVSDSVLKFTMVPSTTLSWRRKAFCIYIRPRCGLKRKNVATCKISHYSVGLL